jgi:gliding motility-associated-like protein
LYGSGGLLYSWLPTTGLTNPAIATPLASPATTTTYTLTVSDQNGCSDTDAVTLTVLSDVGIVVANMITPNSDGFNDVWNIIGIEQYPGNAITVYNTNGIQVFAADNYDNTWGGTFNGELLPDGTYYYVIKLPNVDDDIKGAVNILQAKK